MLAQAVLGLEAGTKSSFRCRWAVLCAAWCTPLLLCSSKPKCKTEHIKIAKKKAKNLEIFLENPPEKIRLGKSRGTTGRGRDGKIWSGLERDGSGSGTGKHATFRSQPRFPDRAPLLASVSTVYHPAISYLVPVSLVYHPSACYLPDCFRPVSWPGVVPIPSRRSLTVSNWACI